MEFRQCFWRPFRYGGLAAAIALISLAWRAEAQDVDLNFSGKPVYIESSEIEDERKRDDWSGQLGVGLSLTPDFLGAKHHKVSGAIQFRASWRDKIFIENNKIGSVLYTSRFLKAGVIARWNLGRRSDLTLRQATGAEKVGDAIEVGVFGATRLYKLFLTTEIYQGISDVHRGLNVEFEAGYTFEFNSQLRFTPILGLNWGSKKFNQAFFGIEPGNSDFAPYEASSGLYEMFGEVSAEHRLSKNWLVKGSLRVSDLKNSAAKSPIVQSDLGSKWQAAAYLGIVWLF